VEFINYEGPYSRIETRAQIRAVGYSQGLLVKNGVNNPGTSDRYFVIHSVSDGDGSKLDADIFGLGVDVGVDHIGNLRLIIQGFLEGAYDYSEEDAALLAQYVTMYNAVYRGDWEYFGSRYKNPVIESLTRERAGLSIRFDEWPGRTLMLIPLGPESIGPLNSVDTSSLSDSRVTEQLRQEPDQGVDTRQDMVDLKERQSEEASQQAAVQREVIREEEERIAVEREEAAQQREQARQEQQQIAQERQQPGANQEQLNQREEAARQQEEEADERDRQLDQQEESLENRRQEAERIQEFADQKTEEARQDREEIAIDQQVIINQEHTEQTPVEGILGASILGANDSLGQVVKLSPDNGQEVKRSPLNTVNIRTLTLLGNKIIAVAGENRGNGAIRLIEINKDTLEMVKQGEDDISPQSLLWTDGSSLYAIVSMEGNLYLARFNTDLVRQARSSITIHPHGGIMFSDGYIITQRSDGNAVLLNSADLAERR
jgi:hypothetical protein